MTEVMPAPLLTDRLDGAPVVISSCARGVPVAAQRLTLHHGRVSAGAVVAAQVLSVGSYSVVELSDGRERRIWPGDVIVGVAGTRHSTTSIYGDVPADGIEAPGSASMHLLAIGGVVGCARSWPYHMGRPTELRPLGLVCCDGGTGRTASLVPQQEDHITPIPVLLIGGTAAEVGKTTLAAKLVHHLSHRHRLTVGVTKLAGTGRMRDLRSLMDAGGHAGLDFVDAGAPTTYGLPSDTVAGMARWLVQRLGQHGADVVVAELGGDLLGANVRAILTDPVVRALTRHLVIVGSDVMSCMGAVEWLRANEIDQVVSCAIPLRTPAASTERLANTLGSTALDVDDPIVLDGFVERCGLSTTTPADKDV